MHTVNRIPHQPVDPAAGPASCPDANELAQLAARLRVTTSALHRHEPDPANGAAWVHFDTALSELHGALVALEEVERACRSVSAGSSLATDGMPRSRWSG